MDDAASTLAPLDNASFDPTSLSVLQALRDFTSPEILSEKNGNAYACEKCCKKVHYFLKYFLIMDCRTKRITSWLKEELWMPRNDTSFL